MKIVAIRDMSAGNETIGETWQETKIFDGSTPVSEIIKWAAEYVPTTKYQREYLAKRVVLTLPHGEQISEPTAAQPEERKHD